MKARAFFVGHLSRALFGLLFALDVCAIYRITAGNVRYTLIGAAAVIAGTALQTAFGLLALKAQPLGNFTENDAEYLRSCLREVMRRSAQTGRKPVRVSLYVGESEACGCCSVGRNIIVNRGLINLGDSEMLEGAIAHELSHIYNLDGCFYALLRLNIFAAAAVLMINSWGISITAFIIAALLFGLIFSAFIGFAAGTLLAKAVKNLCELIIRAFRLICKALSALLCRVQEYEADRFAVMLGYGPALISLFRLRERTEIRAVQTSAIEDMLSEHPSDYRRSIRIRKLEETLTANEQALVRHNNPF